MDANKYPIDSAGIQADSEYGASLAARNLRNKLGYVSPGDPGIKTFFADFDVIISLSTAGVAPSRETTELPDPALMWTLTHLPVVSVPQFTSPSGLPFGMQVVARKYNDYLLFDFLDQLQLSGYIPSKAGFAVSKDK